MDFLLIVVIALVLLGVVAAILSRGDNEPVLPPDDNGNCDACSSRGDCKLAELKQEGERRRMEKATCHESKGGRTSLILFYLCTLLLFTACSTKKNTPQSRWWQSFTARYNTYYNGSQAFIEGSLEKENGNKDNYTELLPLYTVSNKQSRDLGKGNFDRAIEKSQKAIKQHSIKVRPEWNKGRRKTQKDIEWLNRREYNPFIWHAWLLMGKSQFQQGQFEEAAATFSYMTRLFATQPAILGIARAWQAKSYVELDWLYDAEDIIIKQRRDTMHFRARKDWDYTMADYYLRSGQYDQATSYLRRVIRHEKRRKQKAREWFLMGQLQTRLGHREEAYKAFQHVTRLNPPYELEFNARIAQTEVMAQGNVKRMISRLRRMAASDNNKEYLDQVYYAIGNIYMAQKDTTQAIEAYEKGAKEATRNGIEKGVLLLTLGNVYWQREKYADAQRCYGEAIGLLDKDRPDYEQLAYRSKVLDELAPHTSAVELQDSLQRLAKMTDEERDKVIDKLIEELKKKEKEEQLAQEEAEAEKVLARQSAVGNRQQNRNTPTPTTPTTGNGQWYFYNPQSVNQGKRTFEQQWGRRENADDWQRMNKTVVATTAAETAENADSLDMAGETDADTAANDSVAGTQPEVNDSLANDPHNREYYLAQIPFTDEQIEASNQLIQDGLFHSGIIFKDKLDNLPLSERTLKRLLTQYPAYEHNDETLYHLFLIYSRQQRKAEVDTLLARLTADYPESQWTILLNDPNFAENQRFGEHIEDSIYAATYEAFKADRHDEVRANAELSASRFPLGIHRPKFLFVEGMTLLNQGDAQACTERMQQVVEKYPQSEVSELAGMIIKGVQQGRRLHGGKFDIGDVWSRRASDIARDSSQTDTLRFERATKYVFLLAYHPDSVSQNQLLYEMARYNFSNYMVRNFDIVTDQDANGLSRMLISGFLNYDETRQYARQLHGATGKLAELLKACRSLIISEDNLRLLGTAYSYRDYEIFFEQKIEPVKISDRPLLEEPEVIIHQADEEDAETKPAAGGQQQPTGNEPTDDPLFEQPAGQPNDFPDFDEDFW